MLKNNKTPQGKVLRAQRFLAHKAFSGGVLNLFFARHMAEYKKSPRKLLLTRIISDYVISIRISTLENYALRALILLISPDFLLAEVFL